MIGAFLLSSPNGSRNRSLFPELISLNEGDDIRTLLVSSVAVDDKGNRAKVSSMCLPSESVTTEMVDPYPLEVAANQYPRNPYMIDLTTEPEFAGFAPPDVLGIGNFDVNSIPSRSTCIFSSLKGTAFHEGAEGNNQLPGSLLLRMSLDDSPGVTFIHKAKKNILDNLGGRCTASIVSVGPDPLLVLMRKDMNIYLNLVARGGNFYMVWSDFKLPYLRGDTYQWSIDTFDRGETNMILGFSLRMLRTKWVRWLTPNVKPKSAASVDILRVPKAMSALQEWLYRHSAY